ncbi:Nucleosomal histone H3-Lys79 methylase [Tilletia horrida]|uniref:Histone-lysine N-methyltransferase, H3 lysine-79 specific n=1 Tax=Tilletia horrida TaxID=155126 RepID=A0AAN6JMQ7_9BASI|nr:Nucleosomal histone H3-Lys79 methylase [Tilletia horrida]
MAGLDFFGSGPSSSSTHSHGRAVPSAAGSSASATRKAVPASSARGTSVPLRSIGSAVAAASASATGRSASGSPSVPRSPLRGGAKSSSSSPRPAPSGGSGSGSSSAYKPVTVVVRTVTAKPKPAAANGVNGSHSGLGSGHFKYNALPEERRLRIAQEREQRLREQAEKADAERAKAQTASASVSSSSNSTRPLKKRRTASVISDGKRKSPQSSNGDHPRRRNARTRTVLSDEDDADEDADLFGKEATPSRSARDSSRDEWVIPPRQPRNVVREDEEEAVQQAAKEGDDDTTAASPSADGSAGIQSGTRSYKAISSMDVVNEAGIKIFAPYFKDIDDLTTITLEYPALGASETFPLLVPRPLDEYDPISDLLRTVHVMVSSYFPNEEMRRRLFGKLEELEPTSGRLLPRDAMSPLQVTSVLSGQVTPNGSSVAAVGAGAIHSSNSVLSPLTSIASGASTPLRFTPSSSSQGGLSLVQSTSADRLATPQPSAAGVGTPTPMSTPTTLAQGSSATDGESILRSFQRARNRRNGPLFLRTVARFNETMRQAKREGLVLEGIRAMSESGIPERLWATIHEQCYARVVGPKVEDLNNYEAFSDNVYGELLPRFSAEIAHLTGLGPASVFVDMGSGVGNVLVQLALQTGCSAYGCEMMETPATLARAQIEEARARWAMWGLKGGEVEAWKDNFCTNDQVREVLRKADVVLVNNYAFTPATNDKLVLQFLDLKDGCHIISLKPFVPPDFRLTERTLSSPLAILRVVERAYTSGCVSWANGGGRYYIHTVDRRIVQDFRPSKFTRGETRKKRWKKNVEEEDDDMMSM